MLSRTNHDFQSLLLEVKKKDSLSPVQKKDFQSLLLEVQKKDFLPTVGENDSLPVVRENDFLPPIGRFANLGGLFIVGAVFIFVALSSVIKYKITVKAEAIVRPAGELRLVQATSEGTVREISATENQVIKKGDIIAIIDDSRLQTQKSQLEGNIGQAQLQLAQISAQISALDSQIVAESDRINRAVASAKEELDRSSREYRDKQVTTTAEVYEASANLKSTQASLSSAQVRWERYQSIAEAGAISKEQLDEAKLAAVQQQQAVEVARARLERVQTALNPSNAIVAIARQGIAQEQASGAATRAILNKEREALIQQRIQIQNQYQRDTRELQQVEQDLTGTAITAVADGIIFQLNLRNPGQTVRSGEEIARIVPSNSDLEVKGRVSPKDIGKLKIGQKVQMRVSACPYPDYGTLKGAVSRISRDTIKPQSNSTTAIAATTASPNQGGSAFYEVTVEPESLILSQKGKQCEIQLGMEGRADIISKEETVLKFLLRKARLITDL